MKTDISTSSDLGAPPTAAALDRDVGKSDEVGLRSLAGRFLNPRDGLSYMVFADQQFDIAPPSGRTDDSSVLSREPGNCLAQARQHLAPINIVPLRPRINYGG
jgi:hypothetical protein